MSALVGAVVGGSGLVGLLFFFLRRYIEQKLGAVEAVNRNRLAIRRRRLQIDDELNHAYGRLFFWMHRAIVQGHHNGELEAAFRALEEAEAKKKDLDREIIAEMEQE